MVQQGLKRRLSGYLLQKEIGKTHRKSEVISLEKAKKIGILYDAPSDKDYEIMKSYVRQLMALSKDVVALGYYNKKELPNTRFMKLGLDFFTSKALNWKMKPHHPIVTNFINRQVDILIVFNIEKSIPISYIVNQVDAGFKIGKYEQPFAGLFDFMIQLDPTSTLNQMIEQVNHYLKLIKNEKF